MTRYHYFNSMFPEEAKKIDQEYTEMSRIIWNAFARATWLHKYFEFTPKIIKDNPVKDQDKSGIEDNS